MLEQLPCIAATHPFTPVVKMRRLWVRLSTHVPTEPAVTGGEHTAVGFSAAGLLLWLSPWQVRGSFLALCALMDKYGCAVQYRSLHQPAQHCVDTCTCDPELLTSAHDKL